MLKKDLNRNLILDFYKAINGISKSRKTIVSFTTDQKLIEHILFFEQYFPKYKLTIDEITSEHDRVIVKGRQKGKQALASDEIPFTDKEIEFPFAIGYHIEKNKIINHWLIVDQSLLMEQMGIIT